MNPEPQSLENQVADFIEFDAVVDVPSATGRSGNNFKEYHDFHLNAKARIWP